MKLAAGSRLGPYEILAPLGAGGMGEVYQARDTRLGREVAIKVLPHGLAATPEARARFEREARAVASLHHPHICTLYDVGHEVGEEYLVLEKLDGETLAARLRRGPLKPAEALAMGIQIAGALDAAHRAGIVHRDLKPGNVMLTSGGAKLLDFGLARTDAISPPPADLTQSPTLSRPLTAEGAIVGTFQYMSPEQLEGREADARSDIYSFGSTMYEAIAGRAAFEGRSPASLIAAILKDEPPSLSALQPLTPPALERVVGQCLAKDPAERWQSAGDLRRELEWISSGEGGGVRVAPGAAPRRGLPARLWIAAGGAAVAVIAAALVLLSGGAPRLNPDMRTRTLDVPMNDIGYPGFSQDGRWIALPARDERGASGLYFMNVSGGAVRPIVRDSTSDINYADISPDGGQIVYSAARLLDISIRVVPSLGGVIRTVARNGLGPRWSPDGSRIGYIVPPFMSSSHGLEFWTVPAGGSGAARVFADRASEGMGSLCFAWAPDGRRIAWLRDFAHSSYNEIVIRDLDSGRERQLTHDRSVIDEVVWTPQDDILFSSNRRGASNVWMMRARGGPVVQVTRGAGPDAGIRISRDGRTLLYLVKRRLAALGWWNVVTGERGQFGGEPQPFDVPYVPSPDGRQIAVRVIEPDALAGHAVVVMSRDGSARHTLVAAADRPDAYDWSPDGRRIAWASSRTASPDTMDLHVVDAATGEQSSSVAVATRGGVRWLFWQSPDTLLVHDQSGSFRFAFSNGLATERSADQRFEYPVRVPGWVVEAHRGGLGDPGLFIRPIRGGIERQVLPPRWIIGAPPRKNFLYCWPESLGFSRLDLPSGRLRRVANAPPGLRRNMGFVSSADGRVVFWIDPRQESKLVLVDHLRK